MLMRLPDDLLSNIIQLLIVDHDIINGDDDQPIPGYQTDLAILMRVSPRLNKLTSPFLYRDITTSSLSLLLYNIAHPAAYSSIASKSELLGACYRLTIDYPRSKYKQGLLDSFNTPRRKGTIDVDTYDRRCARREIEKWVTDWASALECLARVRQDHPDTFNRVAHLSLNPFSTADHFDWTAQFRGQTTIALKSSLIVQYIRELVASSPLKKLSYRDTEGPLNIVNQQKLYPTVDGRRRIIGRHCCTGGRIYSAPAKVFSIELINPACQICYHAYPNRSYWWKIPVGRSVGISPQSTTTIGLQTIITMLRRGMQDRNCFLRRTGAMDNALTGAPNDADAQIEARWTFDVRIHTPSTATPPSESTELELSTYLDENVRFQRSLTDKDGERQMIIVNPQRPYSTAGYNSPQLKTDRIVLVDRAVDTRGSGGGRD